MSRSWFRCLSGLAFAAMLGAGCAKATPVAATPTPDPIVEPPITGTLTINGAVTNVFTTTAAGSVTVTIAVLDPDPDGSLTVGVALGTWNGTQCQLLLTNDNASVGAGVIGAVTGSGSLCVRVYDIGQLTEPVTFTVNVVHY
jgi:hypothetical protein